MNIVLAKLIKFEIMMTLRAVRYVLDANGGLVNPNKLSGYHDFPGKKLKAGFVLEKLYSARNRPPMVADFIARRHRFDSDRKR